jgi:uncharacterized membrane protein
VTEAVQRKFVATRSTALAVAAVAVVLAIALPLAFTLNIWQDEAYTLNTTAHGFAYALHQAISFEQNAPLYFLIVVILRRFGEDIFFLRTFSVLCAAATVALVPGLVRRYVPNADGALLAIVVACNPFLIWAAVELRAYALMILMSALLLQTFYDAFMKERASGWATVGYALCVALALYTQYYLAFIVAAQGLTVLLWYRRRLIAFIAAFVAGCLAFVPMLLTIPGQVQNFRSGFESPSLIGSFATLAAILWHYLLPLTFRHSSLVYGVLTVAVIAALTYYRPSLTVAGGGAIVLITSCAAVLFAAGTYEAGVHILNRHAASLYVPSTLSAFAVVAALKAPLRFRAAAVLAATAIILSLATLVVTYRALANPGDWIRVEAYLRSHERPGEPIVVFEAENALPLAYYYRGPNSIVPVPRGVDFHTYDVTDFVIRDESQLQSVMPQALRVWLVTAGDCTASNVRFGCSKLERYVDGRYRVLSDARFYGSRVRLLERTAAPPLHKG